MKADMRNSIERVAELRRLASRKGKKAGDRFEGAVERHLDGQLPIAEIISSIEETDWRYVVERSGTSIAVSRKSDLVSWYGELLEQAAQHCEGLYAIDVRTAHVRALVAVLEAREQAGYEFQKVGVECRRVKRYLRPDDEAPDAVIDVAALLAPAGLVWDGGYEIEQLPGENEAIRDRITELMSGAGPQLRFLY